MKEINNMKMIECPKCGEVAKVKRNGLLASVGLGGGLIASLTGSVITYVAAFSFLTLGFISVGSLIIPALIVFLLFFSPVYSLIRYYAGYTIECGECGAKYRMSTKEFCESKKEKDPMLKIVITFVVCGLLISLVM